MLPIKKTCLLPKHVHSKYTCGRSGGISSKLLPQYDQAYLQGSETIPSKKCLLLEPCGVDKVQHISSGLRKDGNRKLTGIQSETQHCVVWGYTTKSSYLSITTGHWRKVVLGSPITVKIASIVAAKALPSKHRRCRYVTCLAALFHPR